MSAKLNWPLNSSSIEHLDCERHHVSILLLYWQKKQHILASLRKAEQNIFVPSGLATGVFEELPYVLVSPLKQSHDTISNIRGTPIRGQEDSALFTPIAFAYRVLRPRFHCVINRPVDDIVVTEFCHASPIFTSFAYWLSVPQNFPQASNTSRISPNACSRS
mgnify:CR=1 FL=1